MRLPDPIANTTTEAYLAYKAGVLAEGDLKSKLYDPYNHLDAWLAYWTGLTTTYPVKNVGKNLFNKATVTNGYYIDSSGALQPGENFGYSDYIPVIAGQTYTYSGATNNSSYAGKGAWYDANKQWLSSQSFGVSGKITAPSGAAYYRTTIRITYSSNQEPYLDTYQLELGSEATAYEPYTGEPDMLTDEEAYIAYLSGVTNTYPEEFRDPADIRVAAYLRYLISARWGRPEYPVTNEELYLSMLKTQYIPSGDPSSDIEIDGTAKAPFVDVKMYGDTFQQSYTGKNLCGGTLAQIKNRNTNGTWNGNQYTQSGITWTVYENADGTIDRIEASGQATENGKTFNIESFDRQQFEEQLGSEETYTLSGCPQGGNSGYYVRVASIPWKVMLTDRGSAATGTLVPADGYNKVMVVLCVDIPAGQVNNLVFRPQLEKGSTATSYEPFVGGTPSPNPDYPQPIQTVTGEQTVEVVGKNLAQPIDAYTYSTNGSATIESQSDDAVVFKTSTSSVSSGVYIYKTNGDNATLCPELFTAGYTVSFDVVATDTCTLEFGVTGNHTTTTISTTKQRVSVATATGAGMVFYNNSQNGATVTISNIQVEAGSTATAYEPYSSNDYEINLGKNLFNKNDVVNGIPSATDGSIISTSSIGRTSGYIPVMPNTAYSHTGHPLGWATIAWFKSDKSFIERTDNATTTTSPNEAAYARVSCAQGNLDTCQFEAGEPTSYAPYFTPIELCKLGTYQDYIWKDGESWKVHKATANTTLDQMVWSNETAGSGYGRRYRSTTLVSQIYQISSNNDIADMDCSHYTVGNMNGTWTGGGQTIALHTNKSVYIYDVRFKDEQTTTALDSWLSSAKPSLYYPLATPTDTTITDQTLIAQLEALVSGGAENGTTYIKVDATDPNLPGLLYVEAPKYE